LEELIIDANHQVEVIAPVWLQVIKGKTDIVDAVRRAQEEGFQIICLHVDADRRGIDGALAQSLQPALDLLAEDSSITLQIVPLIPERTTEAWMLADLTTLSNLLITELSANELGLAGNPERFANPKEKLREAIRKSMVGKGAHLHTDIAELYDTMGQSMDLKEIARLPSFQRFREKLHGALVGLNLIF
jgi:hypothetical protein